MAKDSGERPRSSPSCTLGLNLFRALIVYLKPIVPALAGRCCRRRAALAGRLAPLLGTKIAKFEALLTRVELATVESLTKPAPTEANAVSTQTSDATPQANGEIDLKEFQKTELRVARHRSLVRRRRRQAAEAEARRRQ